MSAVDYAALLAAVAESTEEEPEDITADTNLFELGLDSIALMRLVGTWRRAGFAVDFAELAANPTLGAWAALLADRAGTAAEPAAPAREPDPDGSFPLAVLQHAYWFGRAPGQRLGGVAAHLHNGVTRSRRFLESYGHRKAIVLARFIPVVRTVLNPLAGLTGVPAKVFTRWQVLGGLLWTLGVTIAGCLLGSAIPNVDTYLLPITAAIVVVSLLPIAIRLVRPGNRA
ncbi:phosphopantetheine-binding protein [Actinokineospora auranticolor]|uniref:Aryl carrier-like protein n=1 Tax=Actinokineospora auranticolor TaxID=155976 RepID=A0A2S6GDU7_9PSEU|nr:phosphopantetheine-binding protein [Actinokineospora auranticolor]PPK63311.1 aryl carrier-like protein [Actinokineospora auranticolor]